jgi:hypothetical protein
MGHTARSEYPNDSAAHRVYSPNGKWLLASNESSDVALLRVAAIH